MPSHQKRSRVSPEGEDSAAKRPDRRRASENGPHHEAVSNRPPDPHDNLSTIFIDLTADELMEDALATQLHFGSHPLADEHIEVLPESSANAPRDEPNLQAARPVPAYEVCFGLLSLQGISPTDAEVPLKCTPVTLDFEANMLKAYLECKRKCVAMYVSEELHRLVTEYAVTLTATVCGKRPKSTGMSTTQYYTYRTAQGATSMYRFWKLRIIIYGFLEQKDNVANLLNKEKLFLQHPGETEIDRGAKYFNPQYLLAPGDDMPPLEKLNISKCCVGSSAAARNLLQDYERNQILKIFDAAYTSGDAMAVAEPSPRLTTQLERHQIEALTMMAEKEAAAYEHAQFPVIWTPSVSPSGETLYRNLVTRKYTTTRPPPVGGGILADEMGWGKTLSSLALICHSLDHMDGNPSLGNDLARATLIVPPKSTIYGWEHQIKEHIDQQKLRWMTYYGSNRPKFGKELQSLDVVLTTYDTLRSDRKRHGPLYAQEWHRIILDEAHKIRNRDTKVFDDVCEVRAHCRWCLTGTPVQNRLEDFGALLEFVRVPPFSQSPDAFETYISGPVNAKAANSLVLLRAVVAATCLRRTMAGHASMLKLPTKRERIESVEMAPEDRGLYNFFQRFAFVATTTRKKPTTIHEAYTRKKQAGASTNVLAMISMLRLICDHGEALLPALAKQAWRNRDPALLSWSMFEKEAGLRQCAACDSEIEDADRVVLDVEEELACGHVLCESCSLTRTQTSESQPSCPKCGETAEPGQRSPSFPGGTNDAATPPIGFPIARPLKPQYPPSAKLRALLHNITEGLKRPSTSETSPNKCVVFSFWTKMLDLIAAALRDKGVDFCRIDGRSTLSQRAKALDRFGNDPACTVVLASTGAAGEGIDLIAANSVHIVEPHWNPMAEEQAISRIHRIGQKRDVEVVRYIVRDSIENYVQWVQDHKLRMINQTLSLSKAYDEEVGMVRYKNLLPYLQPTGATSNV